MARFFKCLFAMMLLPLFWVSCQENGDIGTLFGQWQLQQVMQNGAPVTIDQNEAHAYYISFQGEVAWTKVVNEESHTFTDVFARYEHSGSELTLQFISTKGLRSDTLMIENVIGWRPFTDVRLQVQELSDDRLVVSQGAREWHFIHY